MYKFYLISRHIIIIISKIKMRNKNEIQFLKDFYVSGPKFRINNLLKSLRKFWLLHKHNCRKK